MKILIVLAIVTILDFDGAFGQLVKEDEFKNAVKNCGYSAPTTSQYTSFVNNLSKGSITTKEEAAMALAQIIHESDGLKAKKEYKCVNTGCPGVYTQSNCDVAGKTYYGRGYIHLTWCSNYKAASTDLYGNDRLVKDPDVVATDEDVSWQTTFWFWKKNVHSRTGVSQGKFGVTTRGINGGECTNSKLHSRAKKRYENYKACRKAFGLAGNGDESGCYN
ncbi:unnamed protein product [Allacma fusca]|uniref:Glycoside hydrolase family 19 catalytic domain-containing protein n=1 Tax=Allacma fusca TaxID=39272 RepID=A0A8J2JWA3_9HEXA|nr:unnamed protein product [Allacma fusca]